MSIRWYFKLNYLSEKVEEYFTCEILQKSSACMPEINIM